MTSRRTFLKEMGGVTALSASPQAIQGALAALLSTLAGCTDSSRKKASKRGSEEKRLVLLPYYAWNNRDDGTMIVWLPTKQQA